MRPYIAIVLSVTVALLFILAVPLEDNMAGMYKPDNVFPENLRREDMHGTHLSSSVNGGDRTMPESPGSGQPQALPKEISRVSETDADVMPEQSTTGIYGPGNREYFIQVGSWKNPVYAEEALEKLMKYYPDAYIVVRNKFHVLRIPGVMTKKQGNTIAKEIQAQFKFNPLVVLKSD